MDEEYQIVAREKPAWNVIGAGLRAYNEEQAGPDEYKNLCFELLGPEEETVGGVIGATYWDWFYLDVLWVKEELRGQGYGDRLLAIAETEARQRGAKHAYCDTFSFQAPDFYKKRGWTVFGKLEDFPVGHTRYFLTKTL